MFKRIICFVLFLLTLYSLAGCSGEIPETETTVVTEATEIAIEETMEPIEETTAPEETEPLVPTAPNGDEITEILHLRIGGLNVREKATTGARILGCYRKGDEITVIGRSENGWLRVYFVNHKGVGKVGYCANGYDYFEEPWPGVKVKPKEEAVPEETMPEIEETEPEVEVAEPTKPEDAKPEPTVPDETEPVETMPPETTVPDETVSETTNPVETEPVETEPVETKPPHPALENQGSYGRLVIPDHDISCQLNFVDTSASEASFLAQHYTDMEDSAAFFEYGKIYIISDHKEQSFANLENVKTHDIAYIGSGDNLLKLYCYKTRYGKNGLDSLKTDKNENGTGFDGYLMYTFSDTKDGYDIYMTYWREKTW